MAVRNWTNIAGGVWSVAGNWSQSLQPGPGDIVTFAPGSYTSVIDPAFLSGTGSPSLSDINLQVPGVTLDVQRSITVGTIDGDLSANGTANADGLIEIGNGAVLNYNPSGGLVNTTNGSPGVGLYFKGDGVGPIGSLVVGGAIDTGGTVIADGIKFDATGGLLDTTAVLTMKNGASWTAQSSETYHVGTVNLAGSAVANFSALPAGALTFGGSVPADQHVVMGSTDNELVLPNTTDAESLKVNSFGLTDKIEIAGLTTVQSATYDASHNLNFFAGPSGGGALLATLTGVTLAAGLPSTLTADHFSIGSDATGTFVDLVSCFAPGTRILTPTGEIMIEDLREGDLVMTKSDAGIEPRPIVWIGHRVIDLSRHPQPWTAAPIRVRRGAITDNVPHRDLLISPDHAIFIDGGLVPTKLLVNGATIVRELPATIEYFHIECESHAIILAEGLTVETYLDTGNRNMFDNAGMALLLHPQFELNSAMKCWDDDAFAPLLIDGAVVEPIWRRLKERAAQLGWSSDTGATTDDARVRLSAKGRELRPISVKDGRYMFVLPRDCSEVVLVSRTTCPAMERPWVEDQRQLGVAIHKIVLHGDQDVVALSADDPSISRGWWPVEYDDGSCWRWTDGAGVIPLPFPTRVVEIGIAGTARYPVAETVSRVSLAA